MGEDSFPALRNINTILNDFVVSAGEHLCGSIAKVFLILASPYRGEEAK